MHDLKATCADRDSKKDHLGILKELSLSKTSNFEHDLSFSFDFFFMEKKKQNKTKKNRGIVYMQNKRGGI